MSTHSLLQLARSTRRDYIIIVSDILSCALRNAKKTDLLYKAALSSAQLEKYLQLLFQSELLERTDVKGRTLYRTTARGREFLEAFDRLARLLRSSFVCEPEFGEIGPFDSLKVIGRPEE